MLDVEGEACWYAAEQGETVHASLRFVRLYMRYRASHGTPHAGGMTIPQFYALLADLRDAVTEPIIPMSIVRGEN